MGFFEDLENTRNKVSRALGLIPGLGTSGPRNPPVTFARTSHAVTLRARGLTIGMIQSWGPTQTRTITPCYEVNAATDGSPTEKVPGSLAGLTIQVTRYDLYTRRFEAAFGTVDLVMLSEQHQPFQVLELWRYPDFTIEGYLYSGCWFSNVGRTINATDSRLVMVNGTLEYTRKVRT